MVTSKVTLLSNSFVTQNNLLNIAQLQWKYFKVVCLPSVVSNVVVHVISGTFRIPVLECVHSCFLSLKIKVFFPPNAFHL